MQQASGEREIDRQQTAVAGVVPVRRVIRATVLVICLVQLVHFAVIEPYYVPTGSMAPALLGKHRDIVCDCCGCKSSVACASNVPCPHCGHATTQASASEGDRILVNKSLLWFRGPLRWEMMVFRLFGKDFVKRIVGLPGELIALIAGDVYVNHHLVRKSFAEARRVRTLLFDNDCQPAGEGWQQRWHVAGSDRFTGARTLTLNGQQTWSTLTYQHYDRRAKKCRPITDECTYNGRDCGFTEFVHDFMLECQVVARNFRGAIAFGITDGGDSITVEATPGQLRITRVRNVTPETASAAEVIADLVKVIEFPWRAERSYHLELALVDRRFTLVIDGEALHSFDLPVCDGRKPVIAPFWFAAKDAQLSLSKVRLYRDVHYAQRGQNAVHGKAVQLGVDQYFVLGDNSHNSEDSRYWPDGGTASAECMIGKPIAVYLPRWGWLH